MSNRPHGLRPVWMLAAMVLMAKASKLGCESLGQEACSSEDEDDFSLIQADRSKAPVIRQRHDRNRAALAQGSIAGVDKQSSNEASENSTVGAGVPEEAETVVVPEAAVEAETVEATEEAAAAGVAAASDAGAVLPNKTTVSLSQQSTQQTAAEHKAKVVAQLGVNEVLIVIGIILIGAAAICLSMALDGRDTRPSSEVGQGDARSQQYAEMKPGQAMDLPPGPQSVTSMTGQSQL